jgi:hypothetical protein
MSRERAETGERRLSPQNIEIAGLNRISTLKGVRNESDWRCRYSSAGEPQGRGSPSEHGWDIRQNEKRLVRLRLSHVSYDSVFYIRGINV